MFKMMMATTVVAVVMMMTTLVMTTFVASLWRCGGGVGLSWVSGRR